MAAAKSIKVEFERERETKGTVRFKEVEEENPVVGTLYVKKAADAKLGNPEALTVTISA